MSSALRELCCFNYNINIFELERLMNYLSSGKHASSKEVTVDSDLKKLNQTKITACFNKSLIETPPKVLVENIESKAFSSPYHFDKKDDQLFVRNGVFNSKSSDFKSENLGCYGLRYALQDPLNCFGSHFNQETWLKSQPHELSNGTLLFHNKIGDGGFGHVFKGTFKDKLTGDMREVAIKVNLIVKDFKCLAGLISTLKREIDFLEGFKKIDPLEETAVVEYISKGNLGFNTLCLVEGIGEYTLYDILKKSGFKGLTILNVNKIAQGIFKTLAIFRNPFIDIVHGDLKPENILFTKKKNGLKVTLIDFGFVQKVNNQGLPSKFLGTIYYKAPEIALALPFDQSYDSWSTACILFETFTGHVLFSAKNDQELLAMIENLIGPPPESFVKKISEPFRYLDFNQAQGQWHFKRYNMDETVVDNVKLLFEEKLSFNPKLETKNYKDDKFFELFYSKEILDLFKELLLSILKWEPSSRALPEEVLQHPFFEKIAIQKHIYKNHSLVLLHNTQ